MALLVLVLDARTDMSPGAPVVTSVLTEDLDPIAEVPVPVGGSREVEVDGGSYLVRAVLPTGSALSARASVQPAEVEEVRLGHVPSPHEWLEWHALLGNVSGGPAQGLEEPPSLGSVWMRVWRREPDGTWALEPVSWSSEWDGRYATARVVGLEPAQRVLQLGGESVPWRLIALPTSRQIEILMQAASTGPELDAGVDVAVVTGATRAEMLLRYLSNGRLEPAQVVAEELSQDGRDEAEDPTSALILGYYLLQVGARPDEEGASPAERFPWLADGFVIEGWRALREGDLERGRRRLIEASSLGVPVYAEGLRLLSLGLRLLEVRDGAGDGEVESAMDAVSGLAAATNWAEPLISYYGPDPASPTLTPPTGVPEGPLTWMGPERPRIIPPRPRWPRWLLATGLAAAVIGVGVWWAARGGGELAADPASLTFGEQAIDAPSASRTITVSNDSGARVVLRSPRIRGPAADDFAVTTDTCSDAELADGRSCSLLVVFTPSAQGDRDARLVVRHDGEGSRIRVALHGVGVTDEPGDGGRARIEIDRTSIGFPADVPEPDPTEDLTISNVGDAVLRIDDVIVDPGQEGFALDPESLERCAEIESESSCSISVAYLPVFGGRGEANLTIASNATDDPLQVTLAGTPRAEATPPEIRTTDWRDSEATVDVTNTGSRAFTPGLVIQNERFSIDPEDCEELSIGGECSIRLLFDEEGASSSEDYEGVLTIVVGSGAEDREVRVPLSHPMPPVVD